MASSAQRLAVRSFALLDEHAACLAGPEKARIWACLVDVIRLRFADWRAAGPYEVAEGAIAYWGGIPKSYVVVFRADGQVFLGRSHGQPGPSWRPGYESMQTLAAYLERHRCR